MSVWYLGAERIRAMDILHPQQRNVGWGLGASSNVHLSTQAKAPGLIRLYQLLLFTMPGTPVFTYGDDIGLQAGNVSPLLDQMFVELHTKQQLKCINIFIFLGFRKTKNAWGLGIGIGECSHHLPSRVLFSPPPHYLRFTLSMFRLMQQSTLKWGSGSSPSATCEERSARFSMATTTPCTRPPHASLFCGFGIRASDTSLSSTGGRKQKRSNCHCRCRLQARRTSVHFLKSVFYLL